MKKVSVIVAIYNVEEYLPDCVESILAQSYKSMEVILVDDGSTDSSGKICDNYKSISSLVRVIHKSNGGPGPSSARNAGLSIAEGDYVFFVDSDDLIRPNTIERLVYLAESSCSEIAVCEYLKFKNINKLKNIEDVSKIICFTPVEALNSLYRKKYSVYTVVWNKLYAKKLFSNIKFSVGKLHEDEFIIHKLLFNAKKVVLTNEKYYLYRQRNSSVMSNFGINRLHSLEALGERIDFFREKNLIELEHKTIKKYLDHEIVLFSRAKKNCKYEISEYLKKDFKNKIAKYSKDLNLYQKVRFYFFRQYPNIYRILSKNIF